MIRINQLTLPVDHAEEAIKKKAAKLLKIDESAIGEIRIVHRSIDARKKPNLLFSYIVDVTLAGGKKEAAVIKKAANQNVRAEDSRPYVYPEHGTQEMRKRPVIIGAGPAGMFAALALAENGYAPILFEQGDAVEERTKKVEDFWKNGDPALDIRSNVQFGEGGAGTFSDGKLNTLVKDTSGRNGKVLSTFVEMGADPSILYDHAPHIGTDVLRDVVRNLRNRIIAGGGEVHFRSEVTEILEEKGRVSGVKLADGTVVETEKVILSVGHSARDLFEKLDRMKVFMEPKPFAVGLRIQHPQAQINRNQYGLEDAGKLGAAPYKVTAKTTSGRGVYSFCMCPGGYVVNSSSTENHTVVNGMSYHDRNSKNANSAIIVSVSPKDFGADDALAGVRYQEKLETENYKRGNGLIPQQLFGDFCDDRLTTAYGDFDSCTKGNTVFAKLNGLMSADMEQSFKLGMEHFGHLIHGFDRKDAILSGMETRTSSPLRIKRDDSFESNISGVYPCGEGAGYAGGITSAAIDGIKVAEAIIKKYRPDFK